MLQNINNILNNPLMANDGEIGRCKDFLFDDHQWTIRYMVADTRKWLPGRKVLISPLSLGHPLDLVKELPVYLTKEQIKESPPIDEDAPVSRQYETRWFDYYHYPYYWGSDRIWGIEHYVIDKRNKQEEKIENPEESHLRSVSEVKGYRIAATDGDIGEVDDFIIDDGTWMIRYIVVDTRKWLPGRKVLISPSWISAVDWPRQSVMVRMDKARLKNSPEYDPNKPVNLEYETRLHHYYGRPRE